MKSDIFLSFIMTVQPDQSDPKCKHIRMNCRACVQPPLDLYGIDARTNTQMLKTPHNLLLHLTALENGRNPYIGTLKKKRGDIFSECCIESFKAKYLRYVNVVLFEMVKTALKDTYLGGTTPTALQNEVSTCRKIYYYKETWVMVNQSVNEFYTQFLLKIYALLQEVGFLLDIDATLFNNLRPDNRQFLV